MDENETLWMKDHATS